MPPDPGIENSINFLYPYLKNQPMTCHLSLINQVFPLQENKYELLRDYNDGEMPRKSDELPLFRDDPLVKKPEQIPQPHHCDDSRYVKQMNVPQPLDYESPYHEIMPQCSDEFPLCCDE